MFIIGAIVHKNNATRGSSMKGTGDTGMVPWPSPTNINDEWRRFLTTYRRNRERDKKKEKKKNN